MTPDIPGHSCIEHLFACFFQFDFVFKMLILIHIDSQQESPPEHCCDRF